MPKYYAIEYENVSDARLSNFPLTVSVHQFERRKDRHAAMKMNWREAVGNDKLVQSARFFVANSSVTWPVRLLIERSDATPTVLPPKKPD